MRLPGRTRVPRVVPRCAPVPGSCVRAIGRRPVAGVSASRYGALLPAVSGASETLAGKRGACLAAAEALPAMRARHACVLAGEREIPWRGSCPRETWRPREAWRPGLTWSGPRAGFRSAGAPDVIAGSRAVARPTAFPLAGLAARPASGIGL